MCHFLVTVVNTVKNAVTTTFVLHGKKLQTNGSCLRLTVQRNDTVTNTRNTCWGNAGRFYSPPHSAWLNCPSALCVSAVISGVYGNQSLKLTAYVDRAVSDSEMCENCRGSPPEISLQLSADIRVLYCSTGYRTLAVQPQTVAVMMVLSRNALLKYFGTHSAVFTQTFFRCVFVEYISFWASARNQ